MSARQRQMLAYIREYIQAHGWPPTVREIGAALGIKSTSTVAHHLRALARLGYVELGPGARTIRVLMENINAVMDQTVH
jgi:repressor LexA